ncbi:MAG TPA: heparinase II/III family protein [Acidimicrobiales bacterium]|nr:heparinase II/III family protein [Acidimicrobiales bacterium]
MNILVTGGSGFLGGRVLPLLVSRGHTVVALARSHSAADKVARAGATPVAGDLDDEESVDDAFAASSADALVNLASLGFGHASIVVAAAQDAGIERAIFLSTTAVFTTLDARSKAVRTAAEATIRASGLRWTILRPTMIYGRPDDRNMARLLQLLRRVPVVPLPGGGRRQQQPVHVDDLAVAVVAALDHPQSEGKLYDIAGPEPLDLRQIVSAAAEAVDRPVLKMSVPMGVALGATRAYERLSERPRIKAEQLERLAEDKVFDISDATRDLDYRPRPFVDGIRAEAGMLGARSQGESRLATGMLWARTLRQLRPTQVAHRVRLRSQRLALARIPAPMTQRIFAFSRVDEVPGWPVSFSPLDARLADGFPDCQANAGGSFRFLDRTRDLGDPPDWQQLQADKLWRYHLHYFEWAWSFATQDDVAWAGEAYRGLWRSWQHHVPFARGDAWSPYVASLRAWTMCGVRASLVGASDVEDQYLAALDLHCRFLRAHLELDVGGNHLVKNIKALVGLGVFLGDERAVTTGLALLERQLPIQVLDDGGHFERSPSYHCQVLGDLIDMAGLLDAAGRTPVAALDRAITSMRQWLGTMLMPDGDVPLFNDCALVGARRISLLAPSPPPAAALSVLQPSGYVVVRAGPGLHLVADVGPPCPPDLPAHAHADCLSFELAVGGERVIVNSGTSTYAPGPRRAHERSTRAHNTVEIDGFDQTEVWATFRAARLAQPTLVSASARDGTVEITAMHDGYTRLSGRPTHQRTWRVREGGLEIVDEITGSGHHRAVSAVHLAPGTEIVADGLAAWGAGAVRIAISGNGVVDAVLIEPGTTPDGLVATRFGPLLPAPALLCRLEGQLPLRIATTIGTREGADGDAYHRPAVASSLRES